MAAGWTHLYFYMFYNESQALLINDQCFCYCCWGCCDDKNNFKCGIWNLDYGEHESISMYSTYLTSFVNAHQTHHNHWSHSNSITSKPITLLFISSHEKRMYAVFFSSVFSVFLFYRVEQKSFPFETSVALLLLFQKNIGGKFSAKFLKYEFY